MEFYFCLQRQHLSWKLRPVTAQWIVLKQIEGLHLIFRRSNNEATSFLFGGGVTKNAGWSLFSRKHWDISSVNLKHFLSFSLSFLLFHLLSLSLTLLSILSFILIHSLFLCCVLSYIVFWDILYCFLKKMWGETIQPGELNLVFSSGFLSPQSLSCKVFFLQSAVFAAPRNCLGSWLHKCGNNNSEWL